MKCLHPVHLKGLTDAAGFPVPFVPCGKCIECLKKKREDWFFRLKAQWRESDTACFITLTIDPEHLEEVERNPKRELQNFMKRLRKTTKQKVSYFAVNEYGDDFGRLHFHMILFNYPYDVNDTEFKQFHEVLTKCWTYGFVSVSRLNEERIMYVSKYCLKRIQEDKKGDFFCSVQGARQLVFAGLLNNDDAPYFLNALMSLCSHTDLFSKYRVITLKRSSVIRRVRIEKNFPLTVDYFRSVEKLQNAITMYVNGSRSELKIGFLKNLGFGVFRRMMQKGFITVSEEVYSTTSAISPIERD